jgi:multidrug efflux pump subunit AcrB
MLIAISVAVLISILVAIFLPLMFSGKWWQAEQEKARARRLTDAKMNARLLRFNL